MVNRLLYTLCNKFDIEIQYRMPELNLPLRFYEAVEVIFFDFFLPFLNLFS